MFAASHIYAVPLQMNKTWDLHFDVDFASAVKTSDETGETEGGGDGGEGNGSGNNHGGTGTGNTGGSSTKPQPIPTVDGTLQAGTYTVSANVWLSREVTGLPLDPHLTSGEFPPMNPVTNNATLVVDANGNGTVTAPILIQSRIMTVRSITGNGVSTSGGSSVSSVTVNLGKIASTDSRITRPVTASVSIGELAMSIGGPIFGGTTEHTWPATFELNISGVPTSGGGTMPAWAVASLTDTTTAQADQAAADAALEAARKANERSKLAAEKAAATELAEAEAEQDGAQAALFWAGGVLLLLIAAGGITIWRVRSRAAESLTKDVL
jgi:hypothetical protein